MATNNAAATSKTDPVVVCKNVNVFYGDKQAINDISLDIMPKTITAFIGPSGCGKSTFLRTLNRMNDTIDGCRVEGEILIDDTNIYHPDIDVVPLRARVGMVFQKPNHFPKSIFDNVAYGPKIHGLARTNAELADIVENALRVLVCGTRLKTASTSQAQACQAVSSSVYVSPAPSRLRRKSFLWMSHALPLTPSQRQKLKH